MSLIMHRPIHGWHAHPLNIACLMLVCMSGACAGAEAARRAVRKACNDARGA